MVWLSGGALAAVVCVGGLAMHRGSAAGSHMTSLAVDGSSAASNAAAMGALPKPGDPVDVMSLPMSAERSSLSSEYRSLDAWTKKLHASGDKNYDYLLKNGPLTPPRAKGESEGGVKGGSELGGMHIMRSASQIMATGEMASVGKDATSGGKSQVAGGESSKSASQHKEAKAASGEAAEEQSIDEKEAAIKARMHKLEEAY